MGNTFFFTWEVQLMEFLQANMTSAMASFASFISSFGEELFFISAFGFVYWVWDKRIGIKIGMNIMVENLIFPLAKNIALRRRPYFDNPNIKILKIVDPSADPLDIAAQGYSFPSGHSSNSMTIFGSLAYFFKNKILLILAIIMPLLVGISRFCLGAHYPTDVLCGWSVGIIVIFLMPVLEKKFKNPKTLYFIIFAIGCVGFLYAKSNDYYNGIGMTLGLLLGMIFEEKFVKFKNTRNPIAMVLRTIGGIAIFYYLDILLKLPFPKELLSEASMTQFIIRFIRYTIIMFVEIGLYPLLFGKIIKNNH